MGQSSEELNAEIEGTRKSLSADLDALQDKVSPSAIMGRRKEAARDRVLGIKDKVMGASGSSGSSGPSLPERASDLTGGVAARTRHAAGSTGDAMTGSPLAAGLIAFSAGLVIAALIPASRTEAQAARQIGDAAQEHGQPVMDQAKTAAADIGAQLKDSATEKAQDLKESAAQSAQTVKDEGTSAASSVADTAKQTTEQGS